MQPDGAVAIPFSAWSQQASDANRIAVSSDPPQPDMRLVLLVPRPGVLWSIWHSVPHGQMPRTVHVRMQVFRQRDPHFVAILDAIRCEACIVTIPPFAGAAVEDDILLGIAAGLH